MKKLVLVTFASLFLLSACTNVKNDGSTSPVLTCPYIYPSPLSLTPLKAGVHFTIKEENVEITHAGWSIIISWMHEAERFSKDAVQLQKFMEACIGRYNKQIKPPEEAKVSWWKFWY